jgi:hypothetical protein
MRDEPGRRSCFGKRHRHPSGPIFTQPILVSSEKW